MKNRLITPEWYCKDIKNDKTWIKNLSIEEKIIISKYISLISSHTNISRTIHLKRLMNVFDQILSSVINENGFLIIKEFPIPDENHSIEAIKTFLLEFCKILGTPIIQNKKLDHLFDIKHIGLSINDKNSRGPEIDGALPLHADHGGLLGMYCLNSAEIGGHTLLASTHTVHYEIEKQRPDLLKILYQPFYGDRRNQEPEGELPYDFNPIFSIKENNLLCQYAGYYLDDMKTKFPYLPPLTHEQREAIEFFCKVASREDIQFEIKLDPGDVIFINNNRVLHGRTAFNTATKNQKSFRHLLRIWLSTPKIRCFPHYYGYPIPDSFEKCMYNTQ